MDHEKHEKHENILFAEEAFQIQGAVFEVSRQMGTGFLEAIYQECLALELAAQQVPFLAAPALALAYKGQALKQLYRPDFVCFGSIIVELKVVRGIGPRASRSGAQLSQGDGLETRPAGELRVRAKGARRTSRPLSRCVRAFRAFRGSKTALTSHNQAASGALA